MNPKKTILSILIALGTSIPGFAADEYFVYQGVYIPVGGTELQPCPENYYCPENQTMSFDENNPQPLNLHPCPDEYPFSAPGAWSEDECYRSCNLNDINDEHAVNVDGNKYNLFLFDQCMPHQCEGGYHVGTGILNNNGNVMLSGYADILNDGSFESYDFLNHLESEKDETYYGLTGKNSFAIDLSNIGIITGRGYCSTKAGTNNDSTWTNPTTYSENKIVDETGNDGAVYCYCRIDTYKPANGDVQQLDTKWVFGLEMEDEEHCIDECLGNTCIWGSLHVGADAGLIDGVLNFSSALYNGTDLLKTPSCVGNTITINWTDATPEDIAATNASSTEYGGDIRTPLRAIQKVGQRFIGWIFQKPAEEPAIPETIEP